MLDKRKIIKVEVYTIKKGLILSSYIFNINKEEFHNRTQYQIVIKAPDIPDVQMGTQVQVVFYYINGDRVKYDTTVDVCTEFQLNVTVGEKSTLLEERRRYYKVETDLNATIALMTRNGEDSVFDQPLYSRVKNINIGGVFLECNYEFEVGDVIVLSFKMLRKEMNLPTRILRIQKEGSEIEGYGCSFLSLKPAQEEILARYVHQIQLDKIDNIKNSINSR